MANRVISTDYSNNTDILKFNDFLAIPVTVSDLGVSANGDGHKIVPAGTIVGGSTKKVLENPQEVVVDKATGAVAATKTFGLTTAGIVVTAKEAGVAGDSIKVSIINGKTSAAAISVAVTGKVIAVTCKDDGTDITSTAAEVKAAIEGKPEAAALVTVTLVSTGAGAMLAVAETALAGGADVAIANYAEGVLLYDVDVTNGPREGSMIIWGFVDLAKTSPGAAGITALPNITFLY